MFTIFVEGVFSLVEGFIPRKLQSEKMKAVIAVVLLALVLALLIGCVCGICMLIESHARSLLGWVLVGLTVAYILWGILLKVFRNRK